MAVDNEQILTAILDLTKVVSEHNAQFTEFRGSTQVRIDSLESDAKEQRLWNNIKMICILPVVAGLHQVAAHFGWIK